MQKLSYLIPALMLTFSCPQSVFAEDATDMHAHHHHHEMPTETKRSEVKISLPQVQMVRQDGKKVQFQDELNDGRIVVLSFIYTTCTAICPMTSQTIYKLQGKLGGDLEKVHLVSVSIDPEQDTPEKLAKFAEKYHASNAWQYYTGSEDASIAIQKAMDAYRGDKMNHVPVTFLRGSDKSSWVRIDGFASADELLHEVHGLLGSH
jgi:protein SCO1/2